MKQENIPLLSYVFIGVTSLVLTYATIADTKDEVINVPVQEPVNDTNISPEPSVAAAAPTASSQSIADTIETTIEKLKSLIPGSSVVATTAEAVNTSNVSQNTIPVAVPVPETKSSSYGGNKSLKQKKKKQKKQKKTRRTCR